jgi:hypothetical protein
MEESPPVTVKVDLPKRVYDFLKNEAKLRNKTVEEYVDLTIQADVAGTLINITSDQGGKPEELAFDLGLDGYISEGKKQWADYDGAPSPDRRQNRSWD